MITVRVVSVPDKNWVRLVYMSEGEITYNLGVLLALETEAEALIEAAEHAGWRVQDDRYGVEDDKAIRV